MDTIQERYARFAEDEARGVSPIYEALSLGVSRSVSLCSFLAEFPTRKQQPNLLLGAVRFLGGTPTTPAELERIVERRGPEIAAVMRSRSTQTNEPARCATLLPALARLPEPLALLEVGASAGLCLLPDHYGYQYGDHELHPVGAARGRYPVFTCAASTTTPLPERLPRIIWRRGIDLNPLDVSDADAVAWLRALVWPENVERAEKLGLAIDVARREPPQVSRGNLLERLADVASTAPAGATLVIFHSAVLFYLQPEERERFMGMVQDLPATWISNEAPSVVPMSSARLAEPARANRFLLSVDGRPTAFTGHHGQSIEWIG